MRLNALKSKTVSSKANLLSKKKAKVIKLPVRKAKKVRELTEFEREQLVLDHRAKAGKLARSILRKWRARLELDEIDSVVDLSLCEAVRRFNPAKGASFITFLFYHLRGNLIRAVSSAANAHGIPLVNENATGQICFEHSGQVFSANEVAEALCSHEIATPDEVLFKKEMTELSRQACSKLDNLEQEIVSRVFMQEQQLMDVAQELGYSRCHISRVKKKALESLLTEMKTMGAVDAKYIEAFLAEEKKVTRSTQRRGAERRRIRTERRVPEELLFAQVG